MKKSLIFTLLIALVSCQHAPRYYDAYRKTGPVLISYRVSEAITAEQREKFGLFQGIENFKSAVFYRLSDGGYEVEINTEDKKLVSLNRDNNAIMITRDYINRFEEIREDRKAFEIKWEIVDYDTMGFAITMGELNIYGSKMSSDFQKGAGGCIIGTLLGGVFLGVLASALSEEQDHQRIGLSRFALGFGCVVGVLLGGAFGFFTGLAPKSIPVDVEAVESIKEARKPRVVDGHE